jgi:hypothetical protein
VLLEAASGVRRCGRPHRPRAGDLPRFAVGGELRRRGTGRATVRPRRCSDTGSVATNQANEPTEGQTRKPRWLPRWSVDGAHQYELPRSHHRCLSRQGQRATSQRRRVARRAGDKAWAHIGDRDIQKSRSIAGDFSKHCPTRTTSTITSSSIRPSSTST